MSGPHKAAGSDRNHGYGRNMAYAGHQALQDYYGGGHFATIATHSARFNQFAEWARENGIHDIARNEPQALIEAYAEHVGELVSSYGKDEGSEKKISVSYGQNLISSAQVVLRAMTGDARIGVSPSEYCGRRSNVRTEAPTSLNRAAVAQATEALRAAGLDRAAAVVALARELGMREREAALADLPRLDRQATARGAVNVQDGTKGGRTAERWVAVSPNARAAIDAALLARPAESRNLLAPDETYRQFVDGELRAGRPILKAIGIVGYHDCRAGHACDRYEQIAGHAAPAVAGFRAATKENDLAARQAISAELGHGRIDVLVNYVGGRG